MQEAGDYMRKTILISVITAFLAVLVAANIEKQKRDTLSREHPPDTGVSISEDGEEVIYSRIFGGLFGKTHVYVTDTGKIYKEAEIIYPTFDKKGICEETFFKQLSETELQEFLNTTDEDKKLFFVKQGIDFCDNGYGIYP